MRAPTLLRRLSGRAQRGSDEGVALLAVVGTMGVVTALALAALFLVVGATPRARASQDSSTALAAAQAGVDEYVSRLTANDSYWTNGGVDSGNAALTTPAGFAAAAGRPLPGTTTGATYKYTVLNSTADIASGGLIQLKVAGTSKSASGASSTRTLIATLKVKGFLNYIYFSDVEAVDPDLWSSSAFAGFNGSDRASAGGQTYWVRPNPTQVAAGCSLRHWAGRSASHYDLSSASDGWATAINTRTGTAYRIPGTVDGGNSITSGTLSGYCTQDIRFIGSDVIRGPLHSNDVLLLDGNPLFTDRDTTVFPGRNASGVLGTELSWGSGSPSAGTSSLPGFPITASEKDTPLPTGNAELLRYVRPKTDADSQPLANRLGCLYRGATKITFSGTKMRVLSPGTTDPNTPAHCYDYTNAGTEQTVDVPPVIYASGGHRGTCSGVGYPLAGEATAGLITTNYDPCRGTAFVSGTLDAATTVAAANDVVVVGDTKYADGGTGTNVLGLVANGYVWVHHPIDSSGNNLTPSQGYTPVHTIQAGILSLQHSFVVQNWNRGAALSDGSEAGKLNVLGAIAQKFRGPVGAGSGWGMSGYSKNYVYDARFAGLQPPYFIKPPAVALDCEVGLRRPEQGLT